VIKLESIYIEEVRGIKKLELDFKKQTFAISGPNGSGKSGIIDAIEFGLTGEMGRLAGRGTKGLSVAQHGPHVDKVKFPDAAFVRLKISFGDLNKTAVVTRHVSTPKKLKIEPDTPAIRAALEEIAEHPEITLSRREILRFILVEPSKRSEEIQTLLNMEEIGAARKALNTAQNRLTVAKTGAESREKSLSAALQLHLQITTLKKELVLESANKRRKTLGLKLLEDWTADTKLDEGLLKAATTPELNKESALRDVGALSAALATADTLAKVEAAKIVSDLAKLDADPSLLAALRERNFVETGLGLVDSAECPLCDHEWPDIGHLKEHLQAKLDKSEEAKKLQDGLLKNAGLISGNVVGFVGLFGPVSIVAEFLGDKTFQEAIATWRTDLDTFRNGLASVEKIRKGQGRFESGWLVVPAGFSAALEALKEKIKARPDQSDTVDAQTFLSTAQVRLDDFRNARRDNKAAGLAKAASKVAYDIYCTVQEAELNALYDAVQGDFSTYYRALNGTDEMKFTAKLKPTAGSLEFDVNFYGRGLYPPAAYHSEGHQDGMGVCLYLALMKRLFGNKFTLSLLDDVVMSVDSGHRYEFCKLLKTYFADTQFIITTHDRLWAEQMKSAGLVTGKSSIVFYSWTIDSGPLVQSNKEIWDEISSLLATGKVDSAAAALRHHLEYAMSVLADQLGARPQYRADGTYELEEMLTSVLKRTKELWTTAAESAKSWGKGDKEKIALEHKQFLGSCNAAMRIEQWSVNKAVHYNSWANFGVNDFKPVVAAFKELMECFRCAVCEGWIYVLPKVNPQSLRCSCETVSFNLTLKPK
jgi:energy-coupling factor transporter ATP-binding protein EcfA2